MKAMMKSIVKLEMTTKQAKWLKALMQNPISDDPDPNNEDPIQARYRREIWDALSKLV